MDPHNSGQNSLFPNQFGNALNGFNNQQNANNVDLMSTLHHLSNFSSNALQTPQNSFSNVQAQNSLTTPSINSSLADSWNGNDGQNWLNQAKVAAIAMNTSLNQLNQLENSMQLLSGQTSTQNIFSPKSTSFGQSTPQTKFPTLNSNTVASMTNVPQASDFLQSQAMETAEHYLTRRNSDLSVGFINGGALPQIPQNQVSADMQTTMNLLEQYLGVGAPQVEENFLLTQAQPTTSAAPLNDDSFSSVMDERIMSTLSEFLDFGHKNSSDQVETEGAEPSTSTIQAPAAVKNVVSNPSTSSAKQEEMVQDAKSSNSTNIDSTAAPEELTNALANYPTLVNSNNVETISEAIVDRLPTVESPKSSTTVNVQPSDTYDEPSTELCQPSTHYSSPSIQSASLSSTSTTPKITSAPSCSSAIPTFEPVKPSAPASRAEVLEKMTSNFKARTANSILMNFSSREDKKDDEHDPTDGGHLMDFLNEVAGGTTRDSPEPGATGPVDLDPVEFTPPESPSGLKQEPVEPQPLPTPLPSHTLFPSSTFDFTCTPSGSKPFTPETKKSNALLSFFPAEPVQEPQKQPTENGTSSIFGMLSRAREQKAKEKTKIFGAESKLPIYKQKVVQLEEKIDATSKDVGDDVYEFDDFEFGLNPEAKKEKVVENEKEDVENEGKNDEKRLPLPQPVYPSAPQPQTKPKQPVQRQRLRVVDPDEPRQIQPSFVEIFKEQLEHAEGYFKVCPFEDTELEIVHGLKRLDWDFDPNEETTLQVVVKEDISNEKPTLKLTIKKVNIDPIPEQRQPEPRPRKRKKENSGGESDDDDEYLPSATRRKKGRKRTRRETSDSSGDESEIRSTSSRQVSEPQLDDPPLARRLSLSKPQLRLLDPAAQSTYRTITRGPLLAKGDFVVDKADLRKADWDNLSLWRLERQIKLRYQPCRDGDMLGCYEMTDHYTVWYDEMASGFVKVNCEVLFQSRQHCVVRPFHPLRRIFLAVPFDEEPPELGAVVPKVEGLPSHCNADEVTLLIKETVYVVLKSIIWPDSCKDKKTAAVVIQLLGLQHDLYTVLMESYEVLQGTEEKLTVFDQMDRITEDYVQELGQECEDCGSTANPAHFHLFNSASTVGLARLLNPEKGEDARHEHHHHRRHSQHELAAATLVLCAACAPKCRRLHQVRHTLTAIYTRCYREVVQHCLDNLGATQEAVFKELSRNNDLTQELTVKFARILTADDSI